jgi:hypothetical protein
MLSTLLLFASMQGFAITPDFFMAVAGSRTYPIFHAPLQTTLVPSIARGNNTATFSRASAATLTDFSGNIKYPISNEARFMGARRVQNLVPRSEADTGWIAAGTSPPTVSTSVSYNGLTATATTFPIISGGTYFVSRGTGSSTTELLGHAYIWRSAIAFSRVLTGSESITVYVTGSAAIGGVAFNAANTSTSWVNFASAPVAAIFGGNMYFTVFATTTTSPVTVYLSQRQIEDVSGQTNTNPSEYVSNGVLSAPYQGAGVNGVQYFNYLNGNVLSSSRIIAGTGALITNSNSSYADAKGPFGYFSEPAATNLIRYSRDLTKANWISTNATTALTQQGVDGASNAASLLTATAANATVLQTITQAATSSTYSVYVKRVSGSGAISIVQGATASDITSLINSGTWTRVNLNASVLNPAVGFNIATNGDAIAVDGNQFEVGSYPSSYIPTTAATVTRAIDVLYYSDTSNYYDAAGAIYEEVVGMYPGQTSCGNSLIWLNRGANGRFFYCGSASAFTSVGSYDGTNTLNSNLSTSYNSASVPMKMALSWSGSTKTISYNGTVPISGSYVGTFGSGNIYVGGQPASNTLTGTQRNIKIWNKAIPSLTLQALTQP